MWKVVITEIQDANTIDPTSAPPGAFFVSTERFAQTVGHLDLQTVIGLINRMQHLRGQAESKRQVLSDRMPRFETTRFAELQPTT
ncbi:MAG TPA: hypothetical protein VFO90_04795 [Terrimicrobiaceae bacterium]|jgi:hypothetical protein|nr:hypothetical protein [Terrimicrobiaceae bacterium]